MISRASGIAFLIAILCGVILFAFPVKEGELTFVEYQSSPGKVYAVLALRNRSNRVFHYFEDCNDPEPDSVLHLARIKDGATWSDPVWDWRAATNCLERPVDPKTTSRIKILMGREPRRVGVRLRVIRWETPPDDFGTGIGAFIWDNFKLGAKSHDRTIDIWCPNLLQEPSKP